MEKCFALVFDSSGVKGLKKGKYDFSSRVGFVKLGFRKKVDFCIPIDVEPEPFKKKVLFVVDIEKNMAVPFGNAQVDDKNFKSKLSLLTRDKFWRFVGGRSLDIVEMLIIMGCGYGILRWLEYFISSIMG